MSDDWDADDFEPPPPVVPKEPEKSQWDDEDKEEEPVKESWEDAGAEKSDKPKPKTDKKKKLDKKAEEAVASEVLSDPVAEKLRQQRLVEESDFKATKELFGGKKEGEKTLDDFIPKSEAEFEEFAELVAGKVTPFVKSFHYLPLLKAFMRKATASLTSKDAKELSATMSAISNEKLKLEKEATAGKKKGGKKQQLKVDKEEDDDFRGGGGGGADDEYDFM